MVHGVLDIPLLFLANYGQRLLYRYGLLRETTTDAGRRAIDNEWDETPEGRIDATSDDGQALSIK